MRASAPSSEWRKGAFAPKLDNRSRGFCGRGPALPHAARLGRLLVPSALRGTTPLGGSWLRGRGKACSAYGRLTEGRKSCTGVLRRLGDSPLSLQIPLPSVRLRLTASSPDGGRSLFGGRCPCWGSGRDGCTANQRKTPCSGGKRSGAQLRCSPHRNGSGRRQIPVPFWAAGRRAHVHYPINSKTANSRRRTVDCARPPNKMGNERDLTKGSVSPFSAHSFSKEWVRGAGAHSALPCSSQRNCEITILVCPHGQQKTPRPPSGERGSCTSIFIYISNPSDLSISTQKNTVTTENVVVNTTCAPARSSLPPICWAMG